MLGGRRFFEFSRNRELPIADADTEEMSCDSEKRIKALAQNEVNQVAAMAESNANAEREKATRGVAKALRLADAAQSIELADEVFEVIELLGRDQASNVQCSLVEQLSQLLVVCEGSQLLAPRVHCIFTPLLIQALSSTDMVRKTAVQTVGVLLEQSLLPQDALLSSILPALFRLTIPSEEDEEHPLRSDEHRVEAASVLCRAVSCGAVCDRLWLLEHFLPRYSHLLGDRAFHIRKAAVMILGELAKMFGEKFAMEFAVPHLVALCKDEMWGVRKAVCEVFVDVAIFCPPATRRALLAHRFVRLLRDNSRWVCFVAFQELGPFISTFARPSVTGLVLRNGQVCEGSDDEELDSCSSRSASSSDLANWPLPPGCLIPHLPNEKPLSTQSLCDEDDDGRLLNCLMEELTVGEESAAAAAARLTLSMQRIQLPSSAPASLISSQCHSMEDLSTIHDEFADDNSNTSAAVKDESDSEKAYYDYLYWGSSAADYDCGTEGEMTPFGAGVPEAETSSFMEKRVDLLAGTPSAEEESRDEEDRESLKTYHSEGDQNQSEQAIVPSELVEHFVRMVSGGQSTDADMNRQCAHNFPAVAFTLGRKNWEELRETYKALAADHQWRVRVSLAHSLHLMAAIVGSEISERDLLPIFDSFRDDVDEVREGVLKHLAEFYKCLSVDSRRLMLKKLPHFLRMDRDCETNWRFRLEFAKQCSLLCELYDVQVINDTISGIALTLATDRVSEVRGESTRLMARILSRMLLVEWRDSQSESDSDPAPSAPLTRAFISDCARGFACSQRWSRRQTFVHMCEESSRLLRPSHFCHLLLPHLLQLASDQVANIRLSVARCLSPLVPVSSSAAECMDALSADLDMDVARHARLALGANPAKEIIEVKERGLRLSVREESMLERKAWMDSSASDIYDSSDMDISSSPTALSSSNC